MAERGGFEPPIRVNVYSLSRRAPSATRPSLHVSSLQKKNSTHNYIVYISEQYNNKNSAHSVSM